MILHAGLRARLARASARGALPQSLLLHGPPGAGKQRLGLWLGQMLLCDRTSPAAAAPSSAAPSAEVGAASPGGTPPAQAGPCGQCRSCRLAERFQHPDLHWFFPLTRPPRTSDPRKLREKLEEARQERLAEWRRHPAAPDVRDPAAGIFLAIVQEIRALAVRRPAMGAATVFVVGDAERMVPQAGNPEAANAFLKLLEEPPEHVSLVLTSSRPGALLPTVRSRLLAVRVPAPVEAEIAAFLRDRAGAEPGEALRIARSAQGSLDRALRRARQEGEEREERQEAAESDAAAIGFVRAALSPKRADRLRAVAALGPTGARGDFTLLLDGVTVLLRDLLGSAAGAGAAVQDCERLRQVTRGPARDVSALLDALDRVETARGSAAGNVNPQAIGAVLLEDMAEALSDH